MTFNGLRDLQIQYNFLNLPKLITGDNNPSESLENTYTATGTKIKKVYQNGTSSTTTEYFGNLVYEQGSLKYCLTDEGHIEYDISDGSLLGFNYFLKDHLDNTRCVIRFPENSSTPTIVQQSDYYPFGKELYLGSVSQNSDNPYRYNGKEVQNETFNGNTLDWYDYGARFYDPAIARFSTVDPLTEKFSSQSSLDDVEDFVTKISEYVGVEIAGAYLSNDDGAMANISKVYIDEYDGNTSDEASSTLFKLFSDEGLKSMNTITSFHTHLTNIGKNREDIERPSGTTGPGGDLEFRDNNKKYFYNFLILTRTVTYPTKVQKIPYTNWK